MIPVQRIERLVNLKRDASALGQLTYLDDLNTCAVELCQRPNDWLRVASFIDALINWSLTTKAGTE